MNKLKALVSKKIMAMIALMLVGLQTAHAELPAAISTQLTSIQADGLELANLVWPVVITLFGALVLFKLFKRFGNKI